MLDIQAPPTIHNPTFLNSEEVEILTGRKTKGRQIETLRKMGIPFWINAAGRAVISRLAIQNPVNGNTENEAASSWSPKIMTGKK